MTRDSTPVAKSRSKKIGVNLVQLQRSLNWGRFFREAEDVEKVAGRVGGERLFLQCEPSDYSRLKADEKDGVGVEVAGADRYAPRT